MGNRLPEAAKAARPGPVTGPFTRARTATVTTAACLLLVLLAAVVLRHGRPFGADLALHRWSVTHRPGGVRQAAAVITATGVGIVPYALAAIAGLVTGRGPRGRALTAIWAMLVLLVIQGARLGLVYLVGRHRPPAADWAVHASGYAFPSGHTVTSATAAGILIWALWPRLPGVWRTAAAAGIAAWAVAVGLTRIYLGVHWPTDVLGGWLMTVVLLGLATVVLHGPAQRPAGK
jgi:membrane-associated phospholipid phosphatase